MATYFWADTHFNHQGIIKYTSRAYRDIKEMNAKLIELWNSKVTKEGDNVWLLGDFGFHHSEGEDLFQIFWKLRGRKHLIIGNHDEKNPQTLRLPWEKVERLFTFKESRKRAELCHYPMETWKGCHQGALMLHGHSHGTLKRQLPHRFDVGVDTPIGQQGPILFDDLVAISLKQKFLPTDAHGDTTQQEM